MVNVGRNASSVAIQSNSQENKPESDSTDTYKLTQAKEVGGWNNRSHRPKKSHDIHDDAEDRHPRPEDASEHRHTP